MKSLIYLCAGLAVAAVLSMPAGAQKQGPTIKKCQDATGKWHYGDNAAAACAQSKITVINQRGVVKREIGPPPTADEIEQRSQKEAERAQAKEQARRDELLLGTYAHEADITYIRDRKVSQVEAIIKASADTLTPLRATLARLEAQAAAEEKSSKTVSEQTAKAIEQTRAQIGKHEAMIVQRRQEQAAIKAQAERDLRRYREIKSQAIAAPAGPTPPSAR